VAPAGRGEGPGGARLQEAAGQVNAGPQRREPGGLGERGGGGGGGGGGVDLVGLAMHEPQYRSPSLRELLRRGGQIARSLHVDS